MQTQILVQEMEGILRHAGELAIDGQGGAQIQRKEGVGNYVTDCDVAVQNDLYERLTKLLPTAKFLGEENDVRADPETGLCWIVDPIDGTTNFIRGLGMSGISVALLENGKQELGMIYQPFRKELFYAARGRGAYCNQRRLQASARPLSQAIVQMGASGHLRGTYSERAFRMMRRLFDHSEDLRSYGVSSLEICNVARGACDVFVEMMLCPWDYAAASLILTEAGGICTRTDGSPLTFSEDQGILAAGAASYQEALQLIQDI